MPKCCQTSVDFVSGVLAISLINLWQPATRIARQIHTEIFHLSFGEAGGEDFMQYIYPTMQ